MALPLPHGMLRVYVRRPPIVVLGLTLRLSRVPGDNIAQMEGATAPSGVRLRTLASVRLRLLSARIGVPQNDTTRAMPGARESKGTARIFTLAVEDALNLTSGFEWAESIAQPISAPIPVKTPPPTR